MAAAVEIMPGCHYWPGWLDRAGQEALADELREVLAAAPLFTPRMPRTGTPFSVRISSCGPLGWVSDVTGYRYQPTHPETGEAWPPMPAVLTRAWAELASTPLAPEACLINWYAPGARMGLHQDRDEEEFSAPVLSLSLGDTALFRIGGTARKDPTRSLRLASGDALLLSGPARLAFHGIDRIYPGTSTLLKQPGRINLTLRRVHPAGPSEIRP
ncbi:alkylated DNA repair protein (DNA oxidative demethylase) [Ancylobacter aquaticus]|uniref:Alkylated DNA repair protein (DNA oxidative demethylase) n=1 Tax=Ancylobacter aquaticus TaxID=100 RepID=A0A4R1I7B7_ANCAQ|nr:alpha-ketoglutarate-dependent dioxygenase AlkB [Ancylobacter aquaticus]TCK29973.1 alkylated DNA repair protein (DNA oxidative demethylase) [Ancylobacter aquaticus]